MKKRLIFILYNIFFCISLLNAREFVHDSYSYIGEWKITDAFIVNKRYTNNMDAAISAYSFICKKIIYKKDEIIFRGQNHKILNYTTEYLSSERMKHVSYIQKGFKELGLPDKTKEVRKVFLPTDEQRIDGNFSFGSDVYIVDKNNILIYWRGWMFKAERTQNKLLWNNTREFVRDSYSYIGEWEITDVCEADASILNDIYDPAEANRLIGERIAYTNDEVLFREEKRRIIKFSTEYFTYEQLGYDLRNSLINPRLAGDFKEIRQVSLFMESIELEPIIFHPFGEYFFFVDDRTLLIHWRGWIFKAERIK